MFFSQRNKFSPLPLQVSVGEDFLSKVVRTGLWNAFLSRVFSFVTCTRDGVVAQDYHVFISLWKNFYKLPLDEYERDIAERKAWYRDQFEALEWFKVLDLVEFVAQKMGKDARGFRDDVNTLFSDVAAPYRLMQSYIVPVRSDKMLVSVNEVQRTFLNEKLAGTQLAFQKALAALAKREDDGASARQCSSEGTRFAIQALQALHSELKMETLQMGRAPCQLIQTLLAVCPEDVVLVNEAEFIVTGVAAAMNLIADAARADGQLTAWDSLQLKASLNLWGEA